jgi:hypothetical protein
MKPYQPLDDDNSQAYDQMQWYLPAAFAILACIAGFLLWRLDDCGGNYADFIPSADLANPA